MIKTEIKGNLIHTFSDNPKMKLLQTDTGIEYLEAIDLYPTFHKYKEIPRTEEEIQADEATAEDYENALKEVGVL